MTSSLALVEWLNLVHTVLYRHTEGSLTCKAAHRVDHWRHVKPRRAPAPERCPRRSCMWHRRPLWQMLLGRLQSLTARASRRQRGCHCSRQSHGGSRRWRSGRCTGCAGPPAGVRSHVTRLEAAKAAKHSAKRWVCLQSHPSCLMSGIRTTRGRQGLQGLRLLLSCLGAPGRQVPWKGTPNGEAPSDPTLDNAVMLPVK